MSSADPPDWQEPDRLGDPPPDDRFCDLVLNGGVASGVVYPWTLVELARHYRFRRIGANSVGAMAATLAAAAEYGRCTGNSEAFEPLRRAPIELASEDAHGQTLMLRLFQPPAPLRRLFKLLLIWAGERGAAWGMTRRLWASLRLYRLTGLLALALPLGALVAGLLPVSLGGMGGALGLGALGLLLLLFGLLAGLWRDLGRLRANDWGLCRGSMAPEAPRNADAALLEWLHEGVQRSAGRHRDAAPLSFADLQRCPRFGEPGSAESPGIELQMFTSHIGLGRAVRLPLDDVNTRFFFDPAEWAAYFPPTLMRALVNASRPYAPASHSDPSLDDVRRQGLAHLRELPGLDMPIVVAARLSLSFPLLFSQVPAYAIDFEAPANQGLRRLRRSWFSDGGLCANFPVHLFDAPHPRWPTFALLLDERLPTFPDQACWMAELHFQGRSDNWIRAVPGASDSAQKGRLSQLGGLLLGMVLTMKDWNDRMAGRLPHTRTRILRFRLRPEEGQLRIDMPGRRILRMAHEYGTAGGKKLVDIFAPGSLAPAWRDHLYVRALMELRALHRHLRGYTAATQALGPATLPLATLLSQAGQQRPLQPAQPQPPDPAGEALSPAQVQALQRAVAAVQQLEQTLDACARDFGPLEGAPSPDLRLRTPL